MNIINALTLTPDQLEKLAKIKRMEQELIESIQVGGAVQTEVVPTTSAPASREEEKPKDPDEDVIVGLPVSGPQLVAAPPAKTLEETRLEILNRLKEHSPFTASAVSHIMECLGGIATERKEQNIGVTRAVGVLLHMKVVLKGEAFTYEWLLQRVRAVVLCLREMGLSGYRTPVTKNYSIQNSIDGEVEDWALTGCMRWIYNDITRRGFNNGHLTLTDLGKIYCKYYYDTGHNRMSIKAAVENRVLTLTAMGKTYSSLSDFLHNCKGNVGAPDISRLSPELIAKYSKLNKEAS